MNKRPLVIYDGIVEELRPADNIIGSLSSLSLLVFTSPAYPANGSQTPEFFMPRAGALSYVEASGAARGQTVTVDILKNGTTIFPTTPKPDAPAAGGLGVRRTPDVANFAQGDRLTVAFSGADGSKAKILTYIAFN